MGLVLGAIALYLGGTRLVAWLEPRLLHKGPYHPDDVNRWNAAFAAAAAIGAGAFLVALGLAQAQVAWLVGACLLALVDFQMLSELVALRRAAWRNEPRAAPAPPR